MGSLAMCGVTIFQFSLRTLQEKTVLDRICFVAVSITVLMSQTEPKDVEHQQFLLIPASVGLQRQLCPSLQCQKTKQNQKWFVQVNYMCS